MSKLRKKPITYVVINLRRNIWSGHIVAMQVYGAYSKEEAKERARNIRKYAVSDTEKRYVHVRKIYS